MNSDDRYFYDRHFLHLSTHSEILIEFLFNGIIIPYYPSHLSFCNVCYFIDPIGYRKRRRRKPILNIIKKEKKNFKCGWGLKEKKRK